MPFRVRRSEVEAKSRIALLAVLDLNLRLMENWRQVQLEVAGKLLDYESTMIMMSVVSIAASKLLRADEEFRILDLNDSLPLEMLTRVNLLSVAAATAINRETVRRKVKALEAANLLQRTQDGSIQLASNVLQHPVIKRVLRKQLDALRQALNQLERHGIVAQTR